MFTIVPSRRFLKSVRKYVRGGKNIVVAIAEEAIHLLSVHDRDALRTLAVHWRDHVLKGDKRGIRELHLGLDDLLLYCVDTETSTVELLDIVNHEELRRW